MGRTEGITAEELRALSTGSAAGSCSEREKAALAYAEAVTLANAVPDAVFGWAQAHFSEDEMIELTAAIAWEICAAKFNRALEIEWASCPIPEGAL